MSLSGRLVFGFLLLFSCACNAQEESLSRLQPGDEKRLAADIEYSSVIYLPLRDNLIGSPVIIPYTGRNNDTIITYSYVWEDQTLQAETIFYSIKSKKILYRLAAPFLVKNNVSADVNNEYDKLHSSLNLKLWDLVSSAFLFEPDPYPQYVLFEPPYSPFSQCNPFAQNITKYTEGGMVEWKKSLILYEAQGAEYNSTICSDLFDGTSALFKIQSISPKIFMNQRNELLATIGKDVIRFDENRTFYYVNEERAYFLIDSECFFKEITKIEGGKNQHGIQPARGDVYLYLDNILVDKFITKNISKGFEKCR